MADSRSCVAKAPSKVWRLVLFRSELSAALHPAGMGKFHEVCSASSAEAVRCSKVLGASFGPAADPPNSGRMSVVAPPVPASPQYGVPYSGVLIIRILLFRVLY